LLRQRPDFLSRDCFNLWPRERPTFA